MACPVDLHLHSHFSDGTWSPEALVRHAVELGMEYIALSDHDTMDGIEEAKQALLALGDTSEAARQLVLLPAIEINCLWQYEGVYHDVHILGYLPDKSARALVEVMDLQRQARLEQLNLSLEKINDSLKGRRAVTFEDVQACAGKGNIGKAHLTEALVRVGAACDLMDAYERFTARTAPCYVQRQSVSPFQALTAIKAAGGFSSIAHPGSETHMPLLLAQLIDAGLEGIEAYHRIHSEAVRKHYVDLAQEKNLLVTGGSDCHGPYQSSADEEFFPSLMGTIELPDIHSRRFLERVLN